MISNSKVTEQLHPETKPNRLAIATREENKHRFNEKVTFVFMAPAVGTDISCIHWTDISCTHWLSHYLANTTAFYVYWGDNSAELSVSLGFGLKVKYGFGCMQQPVNSNQTAVLMIQCFNSGNPSSNYPPLRKKKSKTYTAVPYNLHIALHIIPSCLFTQSDFMSIYTEWVTFTDPTHCEDYSAFHSCSGRMNLHWTHWSSCSGRMNHHGLQGSWVKAGGD